MGGQAGKTVLCDCTFRPSDHMVSISTRRKHRKHYPSRRSLRAETQSPPSTLVSMNHLFTRFEDQEDHYDPEGEDYPRMDDGLPDPLPDTGDNGDYSGFESEDNDRNTIDSMTEEEEVNDEDEDSPSDDDIPGVGEQFYDDIAEWELDRLKALSGKNQTSHSSLMVSVYNTIGVGGDSSLLPLEMSFQYQRYIIRQTS